jgi:hypothetical protein
MARLRDACSVLFLLALVLLLWLPRLEGPIDLRYDAGTYYILGTSLAEGKGYRLLNEPGGAQAVLYPPLLPAFVTAHQYALGSADPEVVGRGLRLSYFALYALYALAIYALARQYLPALYALPVAVVPALYLHTVWLSDLLFADVPFAFLTVLFVLCNRRARRPGWFLLTALVGAAAFLLRTAGVALLAAWVAEGLLHRRWKQAALRAAFALAPVAAWQGYVSWVKSGGEYRQPAYPYQRAPYMYYNVTYADNLLLVDPFRPELGRVSSLGGWARRVGRNLEALPVGLGEAVTAGKPVWEKVVQVARARLGLAFLPPEAVTAPLAALGCLVLAGMGLWLARREWLVPLYVAATLALICLTPWFGQLNRYLTPLTPFLALSLVRLLAAWHDFARRRFPAPWRKLGPGLAAAVLAVALGLETFVIVGTYKVRRDKWQAYPPQPGADGPRLFFYDQAWADFDAALAWLRENARPGEVLATVAPERAYLKTGRHAVMPPMERAPDEAQRLLDSVPVRYLLVDELAFVETTRRYVEPVLRRAPEAWRLVHTVPGSNTRVYRRAESDRPEEAGNGPLSAPER